MSEEAKVIDGAVHIWNRSTTGTRCGDMNAPNIVTPNRRSEVTCEECLALDADAATPIERILSAPQEPSVEQMEADLRVKFPALHLESQRGFWGVYDAPGLFGNLLSAPMMRTEEAAIRDAWERHCKPSVNPLDVCAFPKCGHSKSVHDVRGCLSKEKCACDGFAPPEILCEHQNREGEECSICHPPETSCVALGDDEVAEPVKVPGRHRFMGGTCVNCGNPLAPTCIPFEGAKHRAALPPEPLPCGHPTSALVGDETMHCGLCPSKPAPKCVACEDKPEFPNIPCSVCGGVTTSQPAPEAPRALKIGDRVKVICGAAKDAVGVVDKFEEGKYAYRVLLDFGVHIAYNADELLVLSPSVPAPQSEVEEPKPKLENFEAGDCAICKTPVYSIGGRLIHAYNIPPGADSHEATYCHDPRKSSPSALPEEPKPQIKMVDDSVAGHIRLALTMEASRVAKLKGRDTPNIDDLYNAAIALLMSTPSSPAVSGTERERISKTLAHYLNQLEPRVPLGFGALSKEGGNPEAHSGAWIPDWALRQMIASLSGRDSSVVPERSDVERLEWLEGKEAHLMTHREKLGEGYGIWWNVVKRNKSLSGHPLGSPRAAIDAAMDAASSTSTHNEGKDGGL